MQLAAETIAPAVVRSPVPGNRAIWVGIYSELSEFALMFLAYAYFRLAHPEDFRDGPLLLNTGAGIANTALMLSSSYFAMRGLLAIRENDRGACLRWLGLTLLAALGYLGVKLYEYQWNQAHGVTGMGNSFIAMYYYMTLNHVVHVSWSCLGLLWVMARTAAGGYSAADHEGVEAMALYWHATDLAWIVIFPLAYVLR